VTNNAENADLAYCQINYICIIYTHLNTCIISISRYPLWDKVTLPFLYSGCGRVD